MRNEGIELPAISVKHNGRLKIGQAEVEIPNFRITTIIGRGANAVVAHANHCLLDREVAVKIWLKLRPNDRRDKIKQGIEEANKAARAELLKHTKAVRIFEAGIAGGFFYVVMEYYKGTPLRDWLTERQQKLGVRVRLAQHLAFSVYFAGMMELIHGDIHPGNILVIPRFDSLSGFERVPDFRIVDYGTSIFTSRGYSINRHWRTFEETFSQLISPFSLANFHKPLRPSSPLRWKMLDWFGCYTYATGTIENMILSTGAIELFDRGYYALHPVSNDHKTMLNSLVASGEIKMNPLWLGNFDEWINENDRIQWSVKDLEE